MPAKVAVAIRNRMRTTRITMVNVPMKFFGGVASGCGAEGCVEFWSSMLGCVVISNVTQTPFVSMCYCDT